METMRMHGLTLLNAEVLEWMKAWVKSSFRAPAECAEFVEFAWIFAGWQRVFFSPSVSERERIPPFWIVADLIWRSQQIEDQDDFVER